MSEGLPPKEITKNLLYKKLERIITRNWWKDQIFNRKEFAIYCEAVKYEAKLYNENFCESEEYKRLLNLEDDNLKNYLLRL